MELFYGVNFVPTAIFTVLEINFSLKDALSIYPRNVLMVSYLSFITSQDCKFVEVVFWARKQLCTIVQWKSMYFCQYLPHVNKALSSNF